MDNFKSRNRIAVDINDVKLLDISVDKNKEYSLAQDADLALFSGRKTGVSGAHKLDWVAITVVVQGNTNLIIDGRPYSLQANDMLMCMPNSIVKKTSESLDLKVNTLCLSKRILENVATFSTFNWDIITFLLTCPVLQLSEHEMHMFSIYYQLVLEKLKEQEKQFYRESMKCLVRAFLIDFYGVVTRYVDTSLTEFTQGRNLFKNFISIVASSYPKQREVSYYASKLNVTPKYLSTVCKNTCGETASTLIHKAVLKDISNLLLYSNKSVKEIMVELDFPSLSFFGKYVKKHFGMGPKEYRAKQSQA